MSPAARTSICAGFVGAFTAMMLGRERTRLDNLIIGGIFTAFAAYRDPRGSEPATIAVAVLEGALWGLTDRMAPKVKDLLTPSTESA